MRIHTSLYIRYKSLQIQTAYSVALATGTAEAEPVTTLAEKVVMQYREGIGPGMVKTDLEIIKFGCLCQDTDGRLT